MANLPFLLAPAALAESLELAPDAFIALDSRLRLQMLNRAAEESLGASRQELTGKSLGEVLPELEGLCRSVLADGARHSVSGKWRERWFEVTAAPAGDGIGIWGRDITALRAPEHAAAELHRAELELAEAVEVFHRLGEASQDCIKILDLDTRFLYISRAGYSVMGIQDPSEVAGKQWLEIWRERHRDAAQRAVEDAKAGGVGRFQGIAIAASGSPRWWDVIVSPVLGAEGQVDRLLCISRDITEQRQLETQFRYAQKMETVGALAAGVAHDFNNILAAVMGSACLLADALPAGSQLGSMAATIVRNTERAAHLTKQLLAYAGKDRMVLAPVDLSRLIRERTSLMQASVSADITLALDLDAACEPVTADAGQLWQVIINLLLNSAEAIGQGNGQIRVITRNQTVDAALAASINEEADYKIAPGPHVCLEVSDSGCGMEPGTLRRIFEPFFSTKALGRGLGLSAVHGIVRSHHGGLKVESEPGRGASVRVWLPVSQKQAEAAAPASWGGRRRPLSGVLLVVDDVEAVRDVAGAVLETNGLTVLQAENGLTAIELLRQHPEINAVLLDVTMPAMSGGPAFQEMKRLRPDLPVLISSGYDENAVMDDEHFVGAAGFLAKPYTPSALIARIAELMRR